MKEQLVWERTVNTHGKPGKNISMDLHMEHINRACKTQMGTLGPNNSEYSIDRIGRSVGSTMKVCNSFDKSNKVPEESGKHSKRTVDLDMEKLLVGLKCGKVFLIIFQVENTPSF